MKVNEKTLAIIRNLDVTAEQLIAVTSKDKRVQVKWSGVSALDFIELTAHAMYSVYISQDDDFKQKVTYQQFIELFTITSQKMEQAYAEVSDKTA